MTGSIVTRRIGDIELTVVDGGEIRGIDPTVRSDYGGFPADADWVTPATDVDDAGRARFGLNWLLIRSGEALVAVDPPYFTEPIVHGDITIAPRDEPTVAVEQIGAAPEDVTHVVISHLHSDHFTGVLDADGTVRFPRARHLIPAADWEAEVVRDVAGQAGRVQASLGPVQSAGLFSLFEGDLEVVPGVSVIGCPGETPGHSALRLTSGGETVFHLADLVHLPVEFEQIDWISLAGRDLEDLMTSRRRIFAQAETAISVFAHARYPGFGTLTREGSDAWAWRYV